ncbi:MAG TPA: multicopper oxidase domain-containing protein [Flavobacterium sp.]|jgi:FtsP/CotA-like multicopper oxidase with cupredoxin domain
MKNTLILLLLWNVLPLVAQHDHRLSEAISAAQGIYTCPMHPGVTSDKPGKCPKCGMDLVERKVKRATKTKAKTKSAATKGSKAAPEPASTKPQAQQRNSVQKAAYTPEKPGMTYQPKRVRYDLFVRDTIVNYTGKKRSAIAINGSIPAPTLTFTEGDSAEIHVHNMMEKETSIHWHGVFLPNQYDGVPYLTQMPIAPRASFVYKFKVIQNGTYWYHSHTGLQEQAGMYGALIFNKPNEPKIPTVPVVISDWIDMKPMEVQRRLHTASDLFGIRKNTIQSYAEAIKAGHFSTKVTNEWKRMNAMDVSDVAYDAFLANGETAKQYPAFKAGDKVKLRVINGGASSYFWLTYSGGKMTVVANDGNDVEPVEVDRLIIATAETYDVIVTVPEDMSYEFLFTPEDRTKSASIWLGSGLRMPAERLPRLEYFEGMNMMNKMMDMNGDMQPMDMVMTNQTMDMNMVMYPEITGDGMQSDSHGMTGHEGYNMSKSKEMVTLNYGMLKATTKTILPNKPFRELHFELTGNMNRYVWTLDNKTVSESDKILIKKDENVRITMYNNSMMRHPMHLHGHDFRVINGQGEYAPLKNTLDIMPMETDTIEFAATESGNWFFHCHILYHMMSGMGRIFSYEDSPPNPFVADPQAAYRKLMGDDREFHFMVENDFATNGNDGMAMLANTRWQLSSEWRLGHNDMHGYEVETHLGRYFGQNQWLMPFIGYDWRYRKMGRDEQEANVFGQRNSKDRRGAFSAGVEYLLPLLVKATAEVYFDGNLRLSLRREDVPLTRQLRMGFMVNTDKEYMAGLRYAIGKYFSPSVHYDSDMGFGAGVRFTY